MIVSVCAPALREAFGRTVNVALLPAAIEGVKVPPRVNEAARLNVMPDTFAVSVPVLLIVIVKEAGWGAP